MIRIPRRSPVWMVLPAVVIGMAACGTDEGPGEASAVPVSSDVQEDTGEVDAVDTAVACEIEPTIVSLTETYFAASCSFSSCHSDQTQAGGLDLSSPEVAWAQLVNVPSVLAPGEGLVRVVPGDPDASFLVAKVEGPADGHGVLMPQGATEPLDPDCRIAMLRTWILDGAGGAPPDPPVDADVSDAGGPGDASEQGDGPGPDGATADGGDGEPEDVEADVPTALDVGPEEDTAPSADTLQGPDDVVEEEIPEESCDADLLNDPEHCGACGHTCMGALCAKGMCAPTVLASGEEDIQGVDVAGGFVYWAARGSDDDDAAGKIRRVSVDCCADGSPAEPETVASDAGNPFFVAADHAHVYWTDFPGHSIRRAPGEGGEAEMLEEIMGSPRCLTLSDTHVYWTSQTDGLIQGLPKTMDAGPITLSTILGWPEMIAVSDTQAFWADKYTGAVRSVPLDASAEPAIVSANGGWTFGIDVDDHYVYWSDDFTDEIIRAKHDGSEQMVLAAGQSSPFRLEVQGDHVFWIEISAGSVVAVHRDGGDPLVLAAEQDHIWGLATDETYVYWTQGGDGSVSRVPHGAEPVDEGSGTGDGGGEPPAPPGPPQPCPPDVCDDGHFCTEALCGEEDACIYVPSPACGGGGCAEPLEFTVGPSQPLVEVTVAGTQLTNTVFPDLCNPPPGAAEHTLSITVTEPGQMSLLVVNEATGPTQHEISVRLDCDLDTPLVSPCGGPGLQGNFDAGTYLVVVQQWLPLEAAIENQSWDFTWSLEWLPLESQ